MTQPGAPMDTCVRDTLEIRTHIPSAPDDRKPPTQTGAEARPEEEVTRPGVGHVQDEENDILYDMACQCEDLFNELRSAAVKERVIVDICAEYESRFAIWAAHIGVFARKSQCLDTRLRGYPELQDLCARLLDILQQSLQECVDYYSQPTGSESEQELILDVGDGRQLGGDQAQCQESLKLIEDTLARLNRLGVTIRQSSGAKAIIRARKFAETLDLKYFTSLCSAAVQFLYPSAHQSLKAHLSRLMTDLYARTQHLESRRRNLETRRTPPPRLPTIDESPADFDANAGPSFQEALPHLARHSVQPRFREAMSQSDLSSVKMSYVLGQLRDKEQTPHTIPKTLSIQVNQASYPRPPAIEGKSTRCEWCSEPLSKEDLGQSAWRRHIDRDLKPYICLAEQCPVADAVFPSFEDWFKHMRLHGRRWHQKNYQTASWSCVICSDRHMYNNPQDLCSHMEKLHQDTFTLTHIPAIARQSRVEHRAANECLLCCFTIELEGEAETPATDHKRSGARQIGEGSKSARSSRSMTSPGPKAIEPNLADSDSSSDSSSDSTEDQVNETSGLYKTVARHIAAHLQILMLVTLRLATLQNRDDDACDEVQSNDADHDEDQSFSTNYDSQKRSDSAYSNDLTMERDDESAGDVGNATLLDCDNIPDRVPSPDVDFDFSQVPREHDKHDPEDDKRMKQILEDGAFQSWTDASLKIPSAHSINDACIKIDSIDGFEPLSWLPENMFAQFLDQDLVEKAIRNEEIFKSREVRRLLKYSRRNPRVFLTLAVTELIEKLSLLCSNNIQDIDLPMQMETNSEGNFTLHSVMDPEHRKLEGFAQGRSHKGWKFSEAKQFVRNQWIFLAAIFHYEPFMHTFHTDQPLPYVPIDYERKTGHFSQVIKMGLQEDYVKFNVVPYPDVEKVSLHSGQNVLVVAVKRLRWIEDATEEEFTAFYRAEVKTLDVMRSLAHPHLIQAIATYEKGRGSRECCFVFPWASGGNLRQMWMRDSSFPRDLFPWAWKQIRGLTEALCKLSEQGTRHGDLKPENILIFNRANDPELGSLVIADAGSAKFHATETRTRSAQELQTDTRFFTMQYEPPEIPANGFTTISRKYDSWSLGCVLLEFIIWLHQGKSGLKNFQNDRRRLVASSEDRFWILDADRAIVHPAASEWIQNLLKELEGPPELLAWRELLDLVKTHLLVAALFHRKYIWDFWSELQGIHESFSANQ